MNLRSLPSRALFRVRRSVGRPTDPIEAAIQLFGGVHPDAFFIQIGANDGHTRDPLRAQIRRGRWRGIMVEPVPYVFERLQKRYGKHPRVILEQAAVADRDGILPFYHLREAAPGEQVWKWYHTLGSFKPEVVLGHNDLVPDIEGRMIETQIAGITFDTLCRKHRVDQVDLLLLDTEGYDYEILRSIDMTAWHPGLIVYEHHHLSDQDRANARDMLAANAYVAFEHGLDTAALSTARLESAGRSLRKLFGYEPALPDSDRRRS